MLKEYIVKKGLKQKYIAEKVGVSEVTVSNWVKGKMRPNEQHLNELAKILDVSIEKLRLAI